MNGVNVFKATLLLQCFPPYFNISFLFFFNCFIKQFSLLGMVDKPANVASLSILRFCAIDKSHSQLYLLQNVKVHVMLDCIVICYSLRF